jgi:hypothetical protein
MTHDEFDDWWSEALSKAKDRSLGSFADHPNYGAWMQALGNMHPQELWPTRNETKTFCDQLISLGCVDPEHIVAVFTLLFHQ